MHIPKLQKGEYGVFFLYSETSLPVRFATHVWIVTMHNGNMNRWEILHKQMPAQLRVGYLHKNFRPALEGLPKFYFTNPDSWPAKECGRLIGKKGSLAYQVFDFIEKQGHTYPFCHKYTLLPGPNSNSFVQYIVDQFNLPIRLPWSAIGRFYFHHVGRFHILLLRKRST